jgi:hypothetical protein
MKSIAARLCVVIALLSLPYGSEGVASADMTRHIYSLSGLGPFDVRLIPLEPFDPAEGTLDRVDVSLYGITATTVYHQAFHPLYNPVGVFPLTLRHDLGGFGGSYFDFVTPVETMRPVVVSGPAVVMPPWFIDLRFSIETQTTTAWPDTFISTEPAVPPTISASLNDFYADAEPADDLLIYEFRALAPTLVQAQSQLLLQVDYIYTTPTPIGPISPIGPIGGPAELTTDLATQALFPNLTSIHDLSEAELCALVAMPVPAPGALLLATLGTALLAGVRRRNPSN